MSKTKKCIAILDMNLGNLFSVKNACSVLGVDPLVTQNKSEIIESDGLIIPGVGAFLDAMDSLKKIDLIETIKSVAQDKKPIFGICLGMQLLLEKSDEFGESLGLGLVKGQVRNIKSITEQNSKMIVPHVGWNRIYPSQGRDWNNTALEKFDTGDFFYFVHSYFVELENKTEQLSYTNYGGVSFCSSFKKNNIFATQFHPEKSGQLGLEVLNSWFKQI